MKKFLFILSFIIFISLFSFTINSYSKSKNYASVNVRCSKGTVIVKNITDKKYFRLDGSGEDTGKISGKILIHTEKNSQAIIQLSLPGIYVNIIVKLFQNSQLYILNADKFSSCVLKLNEGKININTKFIKTKDNIIKIQTPLFTIYNEKDSHSLDFSIEYDPEGKIKNDFKMKIIFKAFVDKGKIIISQKNHFNDKSITIFKNQSFISTDKNKHYIYSENKKYSTVNFK